MSVRPGYDYRFIFSLLPLNDRAEDVVNHHSNKRLAWIDEQGRTQLGIEFDRNSRSSKPRSTIAILGRTGTGDIDIVAEGAHISKIHCSFEVHWETNIIMLHDRSKAGSTDFFGEQSMPIDKDGKRKQGERKVAIHPRLNNFLKIGHKEETCLKFQLVWHYDIQQTTEKLKNRDMMEIDEDPQEAWTQIVSDINPLSDTVLPSLIQTRVHTSGLNVEESIRFSILDSQIGSGRFGDVYKAVNVDTGDLFAVKVIKLPLQDSLGEREWTCDYPEVKKEIEILHDSHHVSIDPFHIPRA